MNFIQKLHVFLDVSVHRKFEISGFVVFSRSLRDTFNLYAGPHWSN